MDRAAREVKVYEPLAFVQRRHRSRIQKFAKGTVLSLPFSVVIVTKRLRKNSRAARHHAAVPALDDSLSLDFYDPGLEFRELLEFAAKVR